MDILSIVNNDIVSADGLNTLIFNDPYAKLCFTSMLASKYQKIIYIDLDTVFTAYVSAGLLLKNMNNADNTIKIYLPSEGRFEPLMMDIIDSMPGSSIVIFDSVNSFYNMYYKKIDIHSGHGISNLNHLLSIFLMLLLKYGKSLNIPVLVTSMIRYKKDNNSSEMDTDDINKTKVAIVTGSSSGIGFETSLLLARNGFFTYATMRNLDKSDRINGLRQKERLPLEVLKLDVTDDKSVNKAIDNVVNEQGTIDVLVNNAGYALVGPLEELLSKNLKNNLKLMYLVSSELHNQCYQL